MDAIAIYQLVLGFFFALAQSLLPLLPGMFFGLALAHAARCEVKGQYEVRLCNLSEEMVVVKSEARSELAAQHETIEDLRRRLFAAGRTLKHAGTEAKRHRTHVAKLEDAAQHYRHTLEATTHEMEAAQDLLRLHISEVIDLRRENEALKRDVADAQHDLRFATEEHEWTVYMYERQIMNLQEELAAFKVEKGEACVEGLSEAASFQLDDPSCTYTPRNIQDEASMDSGDLFYSTIGVQDDAPAESTEDDLSKTLVSAPHPLDGSHAVSLVEVHAYWSNVHSEQRAKSRLQAPSLPSSTSLSSNARSVTLSTSFQERRPACVPAMLPVPSFSGFTESAPLLLPGLDD